MRRKSDESTTSGFVCMVFDPSCSTRESGELEGNIWSPVMYRQVGCAADDLQEVGLYTQLLVKVSH